MQQTTTSDGEPVWLGSPCDLANKIHNLPWYGVWQTEAGHLALCRVQPDTAYHEITRRQLFAIANQSTI